MACSSPRAASLMMPRASPSTRPSLGSSWLMTIHSAVSNYLVHWRCHFEIVATIHQSHFRGSLIFLQTGRSNPSVSRSSSQCVSDHLRKEELGIDHVQLLLVASRCLRLSGRDSILGRRVMRPKTSLELGTSSVTAWPGHLHSTDEPSCVGAFSSVPPSRVSLWPRSR